MNVYRRYFGVTRMTQLPYDPRLQARAAAYAIIPITASLFVASMIATLIPALTFGSAIERDPLLRILPSQFVFWELQFNWLAHFPNPALDAKVHMTFHIAEGAFLIILAAGAIGTFWTYSRWVGRSDGLTTEKGDAHWQTPEELGSPEDPKDRLLPSGYDIRRGFAKDDRTKRSERAEAAARRRSERKIYVADEKATIAAADREKSP
jgi:hypothetical protein